MDSPIISNWVSPHSFLGVLGVIFIFFSFFDEISLCKHNIPRWENAASHQGLCCLPKSHKRMPGLYELISRPICHKADLMSVSNACSFMKILLENISMTTD